MAYQYNRQDSIFREQVSDLKLVVVTQDSVIVDQSGQIKKLKRNNRILIGLSVALGIIAGLK
jgi:hypothetical protein